MPHEGPGPVADRQDAPHAHCIIPDRNNRFAFAADLGVDRIYQYALNAAARKISAEAGHRVRRLPRHRPPAPRLSPVRAAGST